tara:strand:+ start:4722 stop:5657 length:936 start_codon:yes stop_codon:yes gene_type:complete
MAFQNNSGDIILDVVLTDEGRRLLAKGDGSFSVAKFALGDDEINYSLFNTGSATALQDLSILQTPILEAFTNNASSMKSKLISLSNNNLLYLPILKLNTIEKKTRTHTLGNFVVCVDQQTVDGRGLNRTDYIGYDSDLIERDGFINGISVDGRGSFIKIDAGIDSTSASEIDNSLIERTFQIEIDSRLGTIVDKNGTVSLAESAIVDDDFIATYIVSKSDQSTFVSNVSQISENDSSSPIDGPVSSTLEFKIRSSQQLRNDNSIFSRIGTTATYADSTNTNKSVKIIDTIVRVTGMTTGYSIDIPVRFAKI